ncbi:hypothetical protein [Burkholderia multivorans]|uniref:hypothetical protein n=1 Tax=Burkholderia multivorans TaxID=87883 RepID=UPI0002E8BCFD|nr:hypothetical protein [Burkholderia multivorans]MBJ9656860.1 hypothetical protein [Burkholderia multivorans]MBN6728834.1 hypothetical protein [Burkholderia multivorans]MBN6737610.1 hypothetical protein [Burkholderia multivorans]MBN7125401.1 hypothetical protein [Burkholderia multivorans]MBN8162377.1 hypothetical protein [Burkholderia multivorans]
MLIAGRQKAAFGRLFAWSRVACDDALQNTVSTLRGNAAKPRRTALSCVFRRELRYRFCDMLRARKF